MGRSNATLPENLGMFEYAHLRAPLPKDLQGSEIFNVNPNQPSQTPETYFLMVRLLSFQLLDVFFILLLLRVPNPACVL